MDKKDQNKLINDKPLIPAILADKKGMVTSELSFLIFLILFIMLITVAYLFLTHRIIA